MSEITNPHDRFFKEIFSRNDVAEDFALNYLPSVLSGTIAPGSFRLQKDSFVDENLRKHFSDLLYQVDFKEGQEGYLFILFEHKSYPHRNVAFQLFRYMARIWERSQKDGQDFLPPVIPLVLYHGTDTWNVPLDFASLYKTPEALKDHLLNFSYHLCDLSAYSDEHIKGGAIAAVTLLLLKHIHSEDLPDRLPDFFVLLRAMTEQSTLEFLRTVFQYLAVVTKKMTKDHFTRAVKAALPEKGESHMSTFIEELVAERRPEWIRQGIEQGIERGIERGKVEGIVEGRRQEAASLTIRQLRRKLGQLDDPIQEQVRQLTLDHLEALGEELLDFSDYSDLEKWLDTVREPE